MELKIVEPQKSSPPVKQWMIGARRQSLKSKVDSFSEIFRSPVQCLDTHDDASPPNTDFVFQNTTLYSVRDYSNKKRHPSEVKPRDSTSSQTKVLDKHTKTENLIFPQSAGRLEQVTEQVTLCSGDEITESAVHRLPNHIFNAGLFGSDPVEYLAKSSPPDFPRARHGSSLDSNVVSSDLHNEVSHPSVCNSHPFSPEGTQFLSAEVLGFCNLNGKKGLTEMCTVESVLHDMEKDLATVRNLEGVKDLPIQTNAEKKRMPADSANATPLADLSPITSIDSTCNASYPASAEGVEKCRTREDSKTGLCLISLMPGGPLQTQHEALLSPEYSNVKGPHAGKTEEAGAVALCARQSVSKTKPEMKTIEKLSGGVKLRKGAKEKKEEEKTGSERMRGLLAVTRAKTRGRISTGNHELLTKVPYGSLDSRGKFERTSPNKATRMSCKHRFGSQTESGREGEKDMMTSEQFVAAPVLGKNITETVVNKSAVAITNYHEYSCNTRSGKVTITSNTMGNVSYGLSSSVNVHSSRMGKALSEAELDSSALLDGGIWSSKHSVTQSAIASGSIEREEKEGEINALSGDQELTKIPQLGIQSRGHQFYWNRKKQIELQSVGNPQCSDVEETIVEVLQSELVEESPGNATTGQGNGLQRVRTQQRRNNNYVVRDAKEEGSHQDTDIYNEVVKGDEEGILFSRELQREWVPEQETKYDVKHYLKEARKIRTVSVQGKERFERNSSSKSNLGSPKSQGELQSTVNKPSDLHLGYDVDCNNLKGISTQEFTQISLPLQAGTRPLIPVHRSGKSVSTQNNKEDNEKGVTPYILSSMNTSPKSCNVEMVEGESREVLLKSGNLSSSNENCLRDGKGRKLQQRKSSRKAGTYKRKDRCSRGGKDAPIVMKEQKKDNLVAVSGSSPLRSCLKRRHSYPEIKRLYDSSRTAHMLASSPLGRLPCSPVYHFSRALPHPSSVKRARRHTVCSLEVEREMAPLCLRKEVYPIGWGRLCGSPSYLCPNLTSSPKALASGFLVSPLAFLSSKLQDSSGNIANRGSNSHNISSSSSWSFSTPTPSCPATSSVCHPLFPATTSSVPTVYQSSDSVSSFCSVPSMRDGEHKLKQEDAEENRCFRLELDIQERCEEKSLSDSEIKMESMKRGEHGKVSQIKIRKTLPKPPTNLTPMGLPKPVRLKKKEFSLEEIYTNKNFHEPPAGRLETIFEVPMSGRDGSVSVTGQRRIKRFVEFPEVGMPRKPRRPVIRTGVSRKAVESSNLARTRRGGNDCAKEGCILSLQKIEAILCSKLEQLDTWIALEENGLSV